MLCYMFMLLNMINMLCKLCLDIKYNCHWEFGGFNNYICLSKHSIVIGKINFNKPKQQFKKKKQHAMKDSLYSETQEYLTR